MVHLSLAGRRGREMWGTYLEKLGYLFVCMYLYNICINWMRIFKYINIKMIVNGNTVKEKI